MRENRTSNVLKNSAAGMIGRAAGILARFILRTVFIRCLGNEYAGISGLFSDILNVLSLMELGLDVSMTRALYGPLAEKDGQRVSAILSFYKKAFAVIGAGVLVSGCAAAPFIGKLVRDIPDINENVTAVFLMYVLTSSVSYFFVCRTLLIKADQRGRIVSLAGAAADIAECALASVFIFLTGRFTAYLILHFVFTVSKNVLLSFAAERMYPDCMKKDAELSSGEKKEILRELLCITAYNISGVAVNSTDSIFISLFAGTAQVAVIGNFTLIVNSVRSCAEQIANAAKPSIGNLAVTSAPEKQEENFRRMNFIAFFAASVCCSCFYSLLNGFVGDIWFDPSYKISSGLIALLTLNFYIAVMVFPVEAFRTANGLFVQGWGRPLCTAGLNIILDFFLGKAYGIAGIFAATAAARAVTQVWFDPYLLYKYVFPGKLRGYFADRLLKAAAALAVCAVSAFLTGQTETGSVIFTFVLRAVIAAAVPAVLLPLLFCRTPEFAYMYSLLKNRLLKINK